MQQTNLTILETDKDTAYMKQYYKKNVYSIDYKKYFPDSTIQLLDSVYKIMGLRKENFTLPEIMSQMIIGYQTKMCGANSAADSSIYMDDYIKRLSIQQGKKLYYLETNQFQLGFLKKTTAQIPEEQAAAMIEKILIKIRRKEEMLTFKKIVTDYVQLQFDYDFEAPCKSALLVQKRNENWMKLLPDLLNKNQCFVDVGAMHLASKCGLIVQLRLLGYNVVPVALQ